MCKLLDNIPDLDKLLKEKGNAQIVLIDQLARMSKEQNKVDKALSKLPKLKIQLEIESLKKYNEMLEACHIMQRTNNEILKKLTVFVHERLRFVPKEED